MAGRQAVGAPRASQTQVPGLLGPGAHLCKRGRETVAPLLVGTGLERLLLASSKRNRAPPTRGPPTYIAAAALAQGFRLPGPLPFREAPALPP